MGVVNVELVVDEWGDVISLTALTSAHPDFTKAVLVAIPEWKFEPGIKDGEPVKSIVQLPMTFMLRAKKGVQEVTPENPLHPGSGGIPLENGAEIMKQQKEMISGSKN